MGLPAGHITDTPAVSRNQQLAMLGNGVVPQQAAHALRLILGYGRLITYTQEAEPGTSLRAAGWRVIAERRICRGCPVRRDCLATALTRHEWGVWGGTTEHERERLGMRRSQRITGGAP
jgi:hypothetical protein